MDTASECPLDSLWRSPGGSLPTRCASPSLGGKRLTAKEKKGPGAGMGDPPFTPPLKWVPYLLLSNRVAMRIKGAEGQGLRRCLEGIVSNAIIIINNLLLGSQRQAHSRCSPKLRSPWLVRLRCILQGSYGPLPGSRLWALAREAPPGSHPSFPPFCTSPSVRERPGSRLRHPPSPQNSLCSAPAPTELGAFQIWMLFSFPKHQEHLGEENEHQTWFGNDGSQAMGGGGVSTISGVRGPGFKILNRSMN